MALPSAQTAAARLIRAVREVGKNHTAEIIAIGVHYCFLKLQNIGGKQVNRCLTVVDGRIVLQLN
jgi:hypothetical protein